MPVINPGRLSVKAAANAALAVAALKSRVIAEMANTGPYVAANTDIGKVININQGVANVFILPAVFNQGDFMMIFNNTDSQITLTQNTGVTLYLPNVSNTQGAAASGNRNVAARGYVTLTTVAANTFVVSGIGVS